uniref:Uncharacterized protein n=1 Tax=Arundo donax TaxID=35708 RepID=A0A0A9H584_ARUDO
MTGWILDSSTKPGRARRRSPSRSPSAPWCGLILSPGRETFTCTAHHSWQISSMDAALAWLGEGVKGRRRRFMQENLVLR